MRYDLIIRPEAEADILEAYNWYEDEEVALGHEFLLVVEEALGDIAKRPLSYQVVLGKTRHVVLRRFPYSIFFMIFDNLITVTACVHHKRHPRVWVSRTSDEEG
ncbi:MAG: type II toxin-antitoxin system RelE/ParE family toxin [Chloracidobacterium sp.]|nr:type II toxin-antitoxin system RelE/ParE family toxin [Chloracidobacterium sp.]